MLSLNKYSGIVFAAAAAGECVLCALHTHIKYLAIKMYSSPAPQLHSSIALQLRNFFAY